MRTVLHSDLNSFFASVECFYNPKIRHLPVAVCGSTEERHGIVLASNQLAKKYGVKTAEASWKARQKCPDLLIVPPQYEKYVRHSRAARKIYERYTPLIEPFGIDECWLELTGSEHIFGSGEEAAHEIRKAIEYELGITASIGVSFNKTFAKLGSDYKKPNAVTVITKENYQDVVWSLPVQKLLYIGPATTESLWRVGISTIGELARTDPEFLKGRFGVRGIDIWQRANGYENEVVNPSGWRPKEKSIGNSTTTPRDMETLLDIHTTMTLLSESVAERMRKRSYKAQTITVSFRSANLSWFTRQVKTPFPTSTAQSIRDIAMELVGEHWNGEPLRSIGVRASDLIEDYYRQYSLYPEEIEEQVQEDLESTVQSLRSRFGHEIIQRGIMGIDPELSALNPQEEDSAQYVAFMR